jgi:hypothetical protein
MKYTYKHLLTVCLLFIVIATEGQNSWQWGKRGGSLGDDAAIGNVEEVVDMTTDTKGNIYVLGKVYSTADVDGEIGLSTFDRVVVASWSCNGNFRWKKVLGSGSFCIGRSIKTDTLGGVYLCGAMGSYNAVGGPGYFDSDSTMDIGNKTMFVVKYDTSGNWQWLKMPQPDTVAIGNPSGPFDMDVSAEGDIYLYSQLTPGAYDNGAFTIGTNKLYVLKYNAGGIFQDVTPLALTVSGTWQVGYGFYNAANAHFKRDHKNGRYYLSGQYGSDFGTMSFGSTNIVNAAYLGSFDSNGNNLWTRQNNGNQFNAGMISGRAATDEDENVYIGGVGYSGDGWNGHIFDNDSFSTFTTSCPFVAKMDKDGNNIWVSNAESVGGHNYAGITLANNIIACTGPYGKMSWGGFYLAQPDGGGSGPRYDNFLARINAATGSVIGLDSLKSSYGMEENASSITSDRNGNFFAAGRFEYDLFVASDTLFSMGGDVDWYVAKFGSPYCNCTVPSINFGAVASSTANTLNFTYSGSTPVDSVTWDFGDGSFGNGATTSHTFTTSGAYTICATAYNSCGFDTYCQSVNTNGVGLHGIPAFSEVNIYPNPAGNSILIEKALPGVRMEIFNTIGQQMQQTILKGNSDYIDVSTLPPGIYLVRLTDAAGGHGTLRFVKQ